MKSELNLTTIVVQHSVYVHNMTLVFPTAEVTQNAKRHNSLSTKSKAANVMWNYFDRILGWASKSSFPYVMPFNYTRKCKSLNVPTSCNTSVQFVQQRYNMLARSWGINASNSVKFYILCFRDDKANSFTISISTNKCTILYILYFISNMLLHVSAQLPSSNVAKTHSNQIVLQ